jgi:hypothetical protein|tara:strand:+ start:558 stop:788 length:231 start_codon:yes stop_codon:yes gene_type:complete
MTCYTAQHVTVPFLIKTIRKKREWMRLMFKLVYYKEPDPILYYQKFQWIVGKIPYKTTEDPKITVVNAPRHINIVV